MDVVKVRRVGNSNVITLPREFAHQGFDVGTEVVLDLLPTGEIVIRPSEVVRARVREAAERLAREHRAGLDRLAAYDRGEIDGAAVRGPSRDKSAHD